MFQMDKEKKAAMKQIDSATCREGKREKPDRRLTRV